MTELQALRLQEDLEKRRHDIWNKSVIPDVKASSTEWISGIGDNGNTYRLAFTMINPYSIMVHAIENISGVIQDEDVKFKCIVSDAFVDVIIKLILTEELVCENLEGYYLSSSSLFSYKYTSKQYGDKTLILKMNNTSITLEDGEVDRLARVLDYMKELTWTLKNLTLVKDNNTTISLKYTDINDITLTWASNYANDAVDLVFNSDEDFQGLILHMKTVLALKDNLKEYIVPLGDLTLSSNQSGSLIFKRDSLNIITWTLDAEDTIYQYKSTVNEFSIIIDMMDKFFQEIYIKCNQTL